GEEVVRCLENNRLNYPRPVLLLLDLKMPRMGGLQVLEYLRAPGERGFSTILLIHTQDHDLNLVAEAYRLGADAFLMKPFEKKEFCSLMSQFQAVEMDCCVSRGEALSVPLTVPNLGR